MGDWIEPFNAFYSKDMIGDIKEHITQNRRSVNSLLSKLTVHYIEEKRLESLALIGICF